MKRLALGVALLVAAACDAPDVRPDRPAGTMESPIPVDLPPVASARTDAVPQRLAKGTPRATVEAAAWAILEGNRPEADFPTESYEPTLAGPPMYAGGGHRANPPQLRLSPPVVTAGLPKEVVARVVRMRFPAVRSCYDRLLREDPGKRGDVDVSVVIAKNGDVKVTTPGSGDPALKECVTRPLGSMKMPETETKADVTATFRLTFVPGEP